MSRLLWHSIAKLLGQVCLVAALGCGATNHEKQDAHTPTPDGNSPSCSDVQPGVRLNLSFDFVSVNSTPLGDGPDVVKMYTNGGASEQSYPFDARTLDASYKATTILRYPQGVAEGAATISYYAIVGTTGNWVGSQAFTADPTICSDVALEVTFMGLGDAGP